MKVKEAKLLSFFFENEIHVSRNTVYYVCVNLLTVILSNLSVLFNILNNYFGNYYTTDGLYSPSRK